MAARRRTKARKELIEEFMMDLRLILAYADGDEDDLVVSMTEPELAEAKDLADLISQAVADEKESREKPKSGHT